MDGSSDGDSGARAATGGSAGTGAPGSAASSSGGTQQPPPEQEVERAFQVPVVSGRWVWTANPTSGRVALIDAKTFAIRTTEAGAGPSYLAALPAPSGGSRALVINTISEDATLLHAGADGEIAAASTLPVHRGANAWAVTPDGRFAIAWTDGRAASQPDPSEGFQDITVMDLEAEAPSSKRLSVGFRPARVFTADDSRHVYVVTDAGIDVIDLLSDDGPSVEREVELSANPANDTAKRDVNLTPDGKLAFVSREGKDYVTVVDLEQGAFKDIALPGVVTDLDLSADASTAVAVIRQPTLAAGAGGQAGQSGVGEPSEGGLGGGEGLDGGEAGEAAGGAGDGGGGGAAGSGAGTPDPAGARSMAVLLPVATIFDAPDVFDRVGLDELFGSVELGARGATALLYSNGAPSTRLTLLALGAAGAARHRTVDLKLPIFTASATPDGAHALVLLNPPAGSAKPGAFAVVPVESELPSRIQGTDAPTVLAAPGAAKPAMVAIDDSRALVTVSDPATETHVAYLVRMPELTVEPIRLASAPLEQASGIVPEAGRAFVAQRHPEGRITFIDLESGEPHTLTGFELSTEVGRR